MQARSSNSIIVSECQVYIPFYWTVIKRGNPVLGLIRNVPWTHAELIVDYEVGKTTGVLFLR